MELNTYIQSCHRNVNQSSPSIITAATPLTNSFVETRDIAENFVLEYGHNLFYWGGNVRTGDRIRGQKTTVVVGQRDHYPLRTRYSPMIGDFHVHPYAKKLSESAIIGPSSGDIETWTRNRHQFYDDLEPAFKKIEIHFVFAGTYLFLLVFRNRDIHYGNPLPNKEAPGSDTMSVYSNMTDRDEERRQARQNITAQYRRQLSAHESAWCGLYKKLFNGPVEPTFTLQQKSLENTYNKLAEVNSPQIPENVVYGSYGDMPEDHRQMVAKEKRIATELLRRGFDRTKEFTHSSYEYNVDMANWLGYDLYISAIGDPGTLYLISDPSVN
jgi:hypothetical protein